MKNLFYRDIYQITSDNTPIQGAKVRGRIRKFACEIEQNLLTENDQDNEKIVRFAIPEGDESDTIQGYVKSIIPDADIIQVAKGIPNPVLSKLNINDITRYES